MNFECFQTVQLFLFDPDHDHDHIGTHSWEKLATGCNPAICSSNKKETSKEKA